MRLGEGPLQIACPLCGWKTYTLGPCAKNQRQSLKSNLRQHVRRTHAALGLRATSELVAAAEIRAFNGIPNTRSFRGA